MLWIALLAPASGCGHHAAAHENLPVWTFDASQIFPADRSLARPEDGVALADGRLIVADQKVGLRLVEKDGSSQPFGDLAGAGYAHRPPERHGAVNGISLEPGGTHLLATDILAGGIYRVALADGGTERVYQHPYGVNAACRDTSGTIWFTQSGNNTEEQGDAGISAVLKSPATGSLWRLPLRDGKLAAQAELKRDGLDFANGIALDERRGRLYLAELGQDRVWQFPWHVMTGELGDPEVLVSVNRPDNLELDAAGRLWVVLPARSEILIVDPDTGSAHSAFHAQTPELSSALPGMLTGVILRPDTGLVHLTGLGNALVRLEL